MIDFKATHELNQVIGFVNDKGETVRTYPLSELEKFVSDNYLNLSYENDIEYIGHGDSRDPRNWDSSEIEVVTPVNEWLDDLDNFISATENFYNFKNPNEFVSANHEQQTIRRVGIC